MLFLALSLAACTGIPVETTPTYSVTSTVAATTSLPPTASITPYPFTRTPRPSSTRTQTLTATTTAVPFRIRPTFDPASIVTVTPALAAQCPTVDPSFKHIFQDQGAESGYGYNSDAFHLQTDILYALNQGASLASVRGSLPEVTGDGDPLGLSEENLLEKDLTGDGISEVVFYHPFNRYAIFTCKNGEYTLALDIPSNGLYSVSQMTTEDLNLDTLPEIVLGVADYVAVRPGLMVFIFGWDGESFQNLSATDYWDEFYLPEIVRYEFGLTGGYDIQDVSENGLKGIAVEQEYVKMGDPYFGPWRDVTQIITWDGTEFSLQMPIFTPPIYRFQAVHDGDRAFIAGEFEKALDFYQQVLDDRNLKAWSEAHFDQLRESLNNEFDGKPTPTALPDDPTEYLNLAAYARFKISLVLLAQGNEEQAREEFERLQLDYQEGQPGYEISQMAKVFWDSVKSGELPSLGCDNVRTYAELHWKTTKQYLDSGIYGSQYLGVGSHEPPVPVYLCPFE